jgi:hypothetical protein
MLTLSAWTAYVFLRYIRYHLYIGFLCFLAARNPIVFLMTSPRLLPKRQCRNQRILLIFYLPTEMAPITVQTVISLIGAPLSSWLSGDHHSTSCNARSVLEGVLW